MSSHRSRSEEHKRARKGGKESKKDKRGDSPRRGRDRNDAASSATLPNLPPPPPPSISALDLQGVVSSLSSLVISKSDGLASLIGDVKGEVGDLKKYVHGRFDEQDDKIAQGKQATMDLTSKFDEMEQALAEALSRINTLELSSRQAQDKSVVLEQRVHVAEKLEPPPPPQHMSFDRQTDPSLIKINSKTHVAKSAVLEAVKLLADKAAIKYDRFEIKGDPVSRWFTIQFKGTPILSSAAASSVLATLKREEGEWERVLVASPTGGLVQIYLGPDKSPKQVRTEIMAKRAFGILEKEGISNLSLNRRRGQVLCDWVPLLMVEIVDKDIANILWNAELRDSLGINKGKVLELFNKGPDTRSTPKFEWVS